MFLRVRKAKILNGKGKMFQKPSSTNVVTSLKRLAGARRLVASEEGSAKCVKPEQDTAASTSENKTETPKVNERGKMWKREVRKRIGGLKVNEDSPG